MKAFLLIIKSIFLIMLFLTVSCVSKKPLKDLVEIDEIKIISKDDLNRKVIYLDLIGTVKSKESIIMQPEQSIIGNKINIQLYERIPFNLQDEINAKNNHAFKKRIFIDTSNLKSNYDYILNINNNEVKFTSPNIHLLNNNYISEFNDKFNQSRKIILLDEKLIPYNQSPYKKIKFIKVENKKTQ